MKDTFAFVLLASAAFACAPACAEAEAQLISKQSIASFRKPDGSVNNDAFGGGSGMANLFNGNTGDDVYIGPNGRAAAGSYVLLDFSKDSSMPSGGWYVSSIDISSKSQHKYSLCYSTDGSSWKEVKDGSGVAKVGTASYAVAEIATHVKVVFDQVGGWTPSVCEIQVYGLNPADLTCLHPESGMTEWELVPGTANCTEFGIDQRQCTSCGAFFRRESLSAYPLGHEYETVLVEHGTSLAYGSGTNVCKRCGDAIPFPEPVDLATLGGAYVEGVVQFSSVTVTSVWHADWAAGGAKQLVDGTWNTGYASGWMAGSLDHDAEYAQFDFANAVDLTAVKISVHNHDQVVEFYSVEGGEEILVGELPVEKDAAEGAPDNQVKTIEFRGVSLSSLRVRVRDSVGFELWGKKIISICELHPYGTVVGAGKSAAVRTRIIVE